MGTMGRIATTTWATCLFPLSVPLKPTVFSNLSDTYCTVDRHAQRAKLVLRYPVHSVPPSVPSATPPTKPYHNHAFSSLSKDQALNFETKKKEKEKKTKVERKESVLGRPERGLFTHGETFLSRPVSSRSYHQKRILHSDEHQHGLPELPGLFPC